jgi:hypothetical protein
LKAASLVEIVRGPAVKKLRADLLTGNLDRRCDTCRLKGTITVSEFQRDISNLIKSLKPPENFDPQAYLLANPDVAAAGSDAEDHFLKWGRFERRALRPESA